MGNDCSSAEVTAETPVIELVERVPAAVKFLLQRGVRCIRCGEPVWQSLGELLRDAGVPEPEKIIDELNAIRDGGCSGQGSGSST